MKLKKMKKNRGCADVEDDIMVGLSVACNVYIWEDLSLRREFHLLRKSMLE